MTGMQDINILVLFRTLNTISNSRLTINGHTECDNKTKKEGRKVLHTFSTVFIRFHTFL